MYSRYFHFNIISLNSCTQAARQSASVIKVGVARVAVPISRYRKQQILHGTKLSRFSWIFDKTRKFSLLISMARSNMYCNLTKPRQFSLHSAKNR